MSQDRESAQAPSKAKPAVIEPKAKPPAHATGATSEQATRSSRLTPLKGEYRIPEQIVGHTGTLEIPFPFNIGKGTGTANVEIATNGDPAIEITATGRPLPEAGKLTSAELGRNLVPISVAFRPQRAGAFAASIVLTASWPDGYVEPHRIRLSGHARNPEHAPISNFPDKAVDGQQVANSAGEEALRRNDQLHTDNYPQNAENELEDATNIARTNAEKVADAQANAVTTVNDEKGSYKRPEPASNPWWDLVELAILLGTAGTAGVLSKYVVGRLGSMMAGNDVHGTKVVAGLADALKDGMKRSAKAAVDAKAGAASLSSNNVIAFFAEQRNILIGMKADYANTVNRRLRILRPLLRTGPANAVAAMQAISDGFNNAAETGRAFGEQKQATSAQFLAYETRASLGHERVYAGHEKATQDNKPPHEIRTPEEINEREKKRLENDGRSREVTKLDKARPDKVGHDPGQMKGLLDIYLQTFTRQKVPRVMGARVSGIAQAVADTVSKTNLLEANVPVRLIIDWNTPTPTIITRDESGRVRVSGNLNALARLEKGSESMREEDDAVPAAEELVEIVLQRPLKSWGVRITTDDQSNK